jgi:hypothetical protein
MLSPRSRYPWARPARETMVIFHLARLYDEQGEIVNAVKNYSLFLDRWGNADILVPAMEVATRRLDALAPEQN